MLWILLDNTHSYCSQWDEELGFPINFLRNVAVQHATSDLVLPLDVDFLPSVGLKEELMCEVPRHSSREVELTPVL